MSTLRGLLSQDVQHLLQLKVALSRQGYDLGVELELRPRALEVESGMHFTIGLIHGIAGFVSIEVADYVK